MELVPEVVRAEKLDGAEDGVKRVEVEEDVEGCSNCRRSSWNSALASSSRVRGGARYGGGGCEEVESSEESVAVGGDLGAAEEDWGDGGGGGESPEAAGTLEFHSHPIMMCVLGR